MVSFRILGIVCFLIFLTPINSLPFDKSLSEILKMDEKEFFQATNIYLSKNFFNPLPKKELWQLLERAESLRVNVAEKEQSQFSTTYFQLLQQFYKVADATDYEALLQIYDRLPGDSFIRHYFLNVLTKLWLKEEFKNIANKTPIDIKYSITDAPLPEELKEADPQLQSIWRKYRSITSEFEKEVESIKAPGWVSDQENWSHFHQVASSFLHGQTTDSLQQITQFKWGGWCGTGSSQLLEPKSRLIFMALLKEHRYSLALGAAFKLEGYESYYPNNDEDNWRRELIKFCGEDWESLYIGSVLNGQLLYLRSIGMFGSPKSARAVLQISKISKISNNSDYLNVVAAFITPSKLSSNYGVARSNDIDRISKEPIPEPLQKELLKILHDKVQPEAGLDIVETVTHLLVKLCRPESKDALLKIYNLPYQKVHQPASLALDAMGVRVYPKKELAPVMYRLLINNQPFASSKVDYTLKSGEQFSLMSSTNTLKDGTVKLSRDEFVDPKKSLNRVCFSTGNIKSPQDLWFNIETTPPANLIEVTKLTIQASQIKIKIRLNRLADFYTDKQMLVLLQSKTDYYYKPISEDMWLPLNDEIQFSSLQSGNYKVQIFVPGAAGWESEEIKLESEPVVVTAQLRTGSDLKFEIIAPGDEKRDRNVSYEILKDGKPFSIYQYRYFDYKNNIYRGLPEGDYKIKVYSSSEKQNRRRDPNEITPITPYSGTEIDFTINSDSPALIDLGKILLKAEM